MNHSAEDTTAPESTKPITLKTTFVALINELPDEPTFNDILKGYLTTLLQYTSGNKSRASRIAGISRWAIDRKLRKFTKTE